MVGHRALLEWLIGRLKSLKVNRSRRGSNKGVLKVEFALLDGDEFPNFLHLVVRRDALSSNENCAESATHYNSALVRSDGHGKHRGHHQIMSPRENIIHF